MTGTEKKARRRIKRMIATGEQQARCSQEGELFVYKVAHNSPASFLRFTLKNGRLYKERLTV